MIRSTRLFAIALCLCANFSAISTGFADTPDSSQLDRIFRQSTLQIATPDARLHTFKVWIADDNERRARGLMFVKQLADNEGMLFVYEEAQRISMWMKNTFIPLDMVFIAADGKVINVAENTQPQSLTTIESDGDAIGVVELKGGTAARLHIAKGARVMHPVFSSASKP
jgi:uncharacterized protein